MVIPPGDSYVAVEKDGFIKWVDFNVSYSALADCLEYDIKTFGTDEHTSWIKLLAYLAATGNGTFSNYKNTQLTS